VGAAPGATPLEAPADGDPAARVERERLYREAEALYHGGRTGEARDRLTALATRPDLSRVERVRALAQRGVIELEDGAGDAAEATLEAALAAADASPGAPTPPDAGEVRYYRGKAHFHLGERSRRRFRAVELDPSTTPPDALAARLDEKASLLIAARQRYVRAVEAGEPAWAVAAGARVGEMYEELRRELLDAPLPPGLDAAAASAYRAELRERVRVLAAAALEAYEDTLWLARRTGTEGPFTTAADEGVERMSRILVEADAGAVGVPAAEEAAGARPTSR
jgi:hypothetical protein